MVSTSEVSVSLTVDSNERLPEIAAELAQARRREVRGAQGARLPGGREHSRPATASPRTVFAAVSHINLRMISQGASEINMSFMIDEDDVEEAVRSLHASSSPIPIRPSSIWKRVGRRPSGRRRKLA